MFRELQRRAPVGDAECAAFRGLLRAGFEFVFQRAVFEVIDEVERAHAVGERFCGISGSSEGGTDGQGKGTCHFVAPLCEIRAHFRRIPHNVHEFFT